MSQDKAKATANWTVLDTTAKVGEPPRSHDQMVDGRVITTAFEANTPLELPPALAQKFVPIDGFIVRDPSGTQIKPVRSIKDGYDPMGRSLLKDDEVIARFEELTLEALLSRVAPLPGGEKLGRNSGKTALVEFLIGERKHRALSTVKRDDPGLEEIGDDDLDRFAPRDEVESHVAAA